MTTKVPDTGMFIGADVQQFGRRYVREYVTAAQGYDILQYRFWRTYLTELALGCFEWSGVPAGIDPRFMEWCLLHYGFGGIFMEDGGHLFAQGMNSDLFDMYLNPNRIEYVSQNGLQWTRHANTWVEEVDGAKLLREADTAYCFDNLNREPLDPYIDWYAKRLATVDRVADVNVGAQRTPWIVKGSEEAKRTRKGLIRRLMSNEQYIEVNSMGDGVDGLDVLNTSAPAVFNDLFTYKAKLLAEALTMLGIDNNPNTEKRERQIVDEVTSNNEQIILLRRSRLECRRSFCERANAMFGLEMRVKWGAPHAFEGGDANYLGNMELEVGL